MKTEATQDLIGKLLEASAQRDAIHIAVAPMIAAVALKPGQHVGTDGMGNINASQPHIGIVDPFLASPVRAGQRCFMFLYPNTATGLRHVYTHPALDSGAIKERSHSEQWMRKWAMEHVSADYYGEDGGSVGEEAAYAFAIRAGYDLSVGPYESARDSIDNEWWGHWEAITGGKGQRGEYFRCAC